MVSLGVIMWEVNGEFINDLYSGCSDEGNCKSASESNV